MKHKFLIFSVVLLLFLSCGKNLQQTPRSTIEAFIENVVRLNEKSPTTIEQAKKLLRSLFSTEKAYESFTTTFRNFEIKSYSIGEPEIGDSFANVLVKMETKGLIGTKEEEKEYTFSLEKKNVKWYIKDIAGVLKKFEKEQKESEGNEEGNT
ncbi:hypothetical protein KAU34_00430 [candidate division WOR-3 bacterium]|nr:hypothetical protein [candidate division WOR-3 bacterium]MCK4574854.1 hypothetical protein [candidate division WOR-3 bacterium]